jgi:hypothetical protein
MLINSMIRALVGADLSCTPPMYRPSLPIHIIAPDFTSTILPIKRPSCHPSLTLRISLVYPKRFTALTITMLSTDDSEAQQIQVFLFLIQFSS